MYCPRCGERIVGHSALCPKCGAVFSRTGEVIGFQDGDAAAAPSVQAEPGGPRILYQSEHVEKRRRWPIVILLVVVLALVSLVVVPLLQEQAAASRDEHRVTFVMKTPGYNDQATPLPVHVAGTRADGAAYDKTIYLDGGGNGIVLEPGDYTLSFPGGSILEKGNVLVAPADTQLAVNVPTGLARNSFVQLPADQAVEYAVISPVDLTEDTLDAIYQVAAQNPADHGKAAELRDAAWAAHQEAVSKKEADTAAIEKKATGPLLASEGDEAQFVGTLEINTPEEVGERLDDENIQWNLYGHTLAVLWLDSPRTVTLETTTNGYYGYYDNYGNWVDGGNSTSKQEYEVRCLVLNNDVEGIYSYRGGDDGTLSTHDGKRVLASGKITTPGDWSTSQISPITLANPTLEDL